MAEFFAFNNRLYFFANESTLYSINSTGVATAVTDADHGGTFGLPLSAANFTVFDGKLYLEAGTSQGEQLVQIGTDNQAHVIDIASGPGGSFPGETGGFGV